MRLWVETKYTYGDMVKIYNNRSAKVIDTKINNTKERVEYLLEFEDRSRIWYPTHEVFCM